VGEAAMPKRFALGTGLLRKPRPAAAGHIMPVRHAVHAPAHGSHLPKPLPYNRAMMAPANKPAVHQGQPANPAGKRCWYAVHTKPMQDARAEEHLRNQGYEVFHPLVKLRRRRAGRMVEVVESMFPRYLFIHLEVAHDNWAPIRSTRGVAGLVRWGNHVPTVPEAVIEDLRTRAAGTADGCLDLTLESDLKPNEKVYITDGPFSGHEALFKARNGDERVIVLLNLMQRQHEITLPARSVSRE
jgi:transcriptional antiterminator RfaH